MIQCENCGEPYPEAGCEYICPKCHGVFDYREIWVYQPDKLVSTAPGIWKYRKSFGRLSEIKMVSLGEGNTPLVRAKAFGRDIWLKCEYQNPTGSFKDRGSSLITSFLASQGISEIVEDSSGNAGASIAAYAARANMTANIFIPDSATGPKKVQIEAYGAKVTMVTGGRSNATEAAKRTVNQSIAYGSHAYLPFNLPGYATIAYEVVEQLGQTPGAIILPVGQGGLLIGIYYGFMAMLKSGKISNIPKLIGVQARACAPLWALITYGPAGMGWITDSPTLAEGIRVRNPVRGDRVLQLVNQHQGTIVSVDEDDIEEGKKQLGAQGLYVEPTSAVIWKGLEQVLDLISDPIVCILTGSGLKSMVHRL